MSKIGRNDPCPCGSGKKYKHCCLPKEQALYKPAPAPAAEEDPQFTCELNPDLDDQVDAVLERLELGQRDGIKEELTALLNRHPNYHTTQFGMGVYTFMVEGNPLAAIPYFEKAVRIFPYFVEGHFNLGGAALKTGNVKLAAAAFRNVLRYGDDKELLSTAREELSFLEKAVIKNDGAASLDAYIENQTLFEEAFEAMEKRKFTTAVEGFKKVLERAPNNVATHGNLGLCYSRLGQKALALEHLDKALALDPEYELARFNRLRVEKMEEGKPDDAEMGTTNYYPEKSQAEKRGKPSSWWEKITKFGKT